MADALKKEKKRGSWLRKSSLVNDDSEKEKDKDPADQTVKNPTFGRSFSRPTVSKEMPVFSYSNPEPEQPPPPILTSPPASAAKSKPGMTGMAAAFDALLATAPDIDESPSPASGNMERKYADLQAKFASLQAAYLDLKDRCTAAEARASEAERKLAEQNKGGVQGPVFSASVDSINAEVSRVRKEIKKGLGISPPPAVGGSFEEEFRKEEAKKDSDLRKGNSRAGDLMEDVAVEKFERLWMTRANKYTFGDWRCAKMPGRALVAKVDGYNLESGDPVLDSLSSSRSYELVEPFLNTPFFADYIASIKHVNFVGLSGIGSFADIPVVISVEVPSVSRGAKLRRKPVIGIVRAPGGTEQLCFSGFDSVIAKLPYAAPTFTEFLAQRFPNNSFSEVRGDAGTQCTKSLLQFESQNIVNTYKIGVIRWISKQTENEAFANPASPDFVEFLEWLGTRIELQGWPKFRGGLNVKDSNVTGTHSYYTELEGGAVEIMFHVSTELPYSESDSQCLERKRHLGNDVVVVVFWEGDGEFDPSVVKSQFNHVFVVVSLDGSSIPELNKVRYRVTVTSKTAVPRWEPFLPYPPVFDRDDNLRLWLLYKLVNGERAAMHAPVFRTKLIKTNTTFLKSMVEQFKSDSDSVKIE